MNSSPRGLKEQARTLRAVRIPLIHPFRLMSYYHMSTAELLDAAGTISENGREADLLARLTLIGYGEDALTELDAMISDLTDKKQARETNFGNQLNATETVEEDWEDFYEDTYMVHVGIARAVFRKDRGARSRLGLLGERRQDKAGRYDQALQLYTNALADTEIVDKLAVRGMDATVLQAAADTVTAIQKADHKQDDHIGLAQQSTKNRQKQDKALAEWLSMFRDIVRPALKDQPEWLERLGIFHRS